MSLPDLTRNAYQSGVPANKWISLCRLFISQNYPDESPELIGTTISNSVLLLLPTYPAEPTLGDYLKVAMQSGLLLLSTFVTTFIQAVQSPELRNPSNIDMLCRIALNEHYTSGTSVYGSIVQTGQAPATILSTVHDTISLLRMLHTLPVPAPQAVAASSEILVLLLSCVNMLDMNAITTGQIVLTYTGATDLLQSPQLTPEMRQVLDNFVLTLSLVIGDNSKAATEAHMVQTMQMALGKGDISEPLPETDLVTCSLLLQHLVLQRGGKYGAGSDEHASLLLSAFFRWSSWTTAVFLRQILIAACLFVSQNPPSPKAHIHRHELWRSFVIGRLPRILNRLESMNPTFANEWRTSWQAAVESLFQHTQLLATCNQSDGTGDGMGETPNTSYFSQPLLGQLVSIGLLDQTSAVNLDPELPKQEWTGIRKDAQASGTDIKDFIQAKLAFDGSQNDTDLLLRTLATDFDVHEAFAHAFTSRIQMLIAGLDWEQLSQLVQVISTQDAILDILALHLQLDELVQTLAVWDQVDLEVVGDPQTTVSNVGQIFLFVSAMVARYKLVVPASVIPYHQRDGTASSRVDLTTPEERTTYTAWQKALFDASSEGIDDQIFRSTRPMTILRIAPILLSEAIRAVFGNKMEKSVLDGGVSYFVGPSLNWTLVGVIKALVSQMQKLSYRSGAHARVITALFLSESTPMPVVRLCAPTILRMLSETAVKKIPGGTLTYQVLVPLRKRALQALGLSDIVATDAAPPPASGEGSTPQTRPPLPATTIPLSPAIPWDEQPAHAFRAALADAHAGRVCTLDLARALRVLPPTKVLHALWNECQAAAAIGALPIARQLATFVLCVPSDGPPLLPLFLFLVLPRVMVAIEHQPSHEQALAIELLVAIVSSSLTAALHLEVIDGVEKNTQKTKAANAIPLSAKLARELNKKEGDSSVARMMLQRLASMHAFSTHFPMFLRTT